MERVLDVAQYIMDEYKKMTGETIDEMKLHKLLYFSQRECLALTNKPLFEEQLEGWKYGPVCRDVRSAYTTDGMNDVTQPIFDEAAYIVKNVIFTYGEYASWKLSQLSHLEISWKNARAGLKAEQNGSRILSLDDMRKDAEKVRPYDHVWDMYYDEFEDEK